jgi:hypothetical protein
VSRLSCGATRAPAPGLSGYAAALVLILLVSPPESSTAQALRGEGRRPFADATSSLYYSRDRAYDMKHLVLSVSFDWQRKWVGGETTITLTPLAAPLQTVLRERLEHLEQEKGGPLH